MVVASLGIASVEIANSEFANSEFANSESLIVRGASGLDNWQKAKNMEFSDVSARVWGSPIVVWMNGEFHARVSFSLSWPDKTLVSYFVSSFGLAANA